MERQVQRKDNEIGLKGKRWNASFQ